MKKLFRSLIARIMLLIALLLAVSQYASLKIFEYFEREPRANAAALQVITVVNFTRASLLAAHENRRLALLSELSSREGVRIYAADSLEVIDPLPDDPYIQLVAKKIRRSLGQNTLITFNHYNISGLWISFSIAEDDYWVVIPRFQGERPFPYEWLGWGAVVVLLSLLGAYFIASRISLPLSYLAKSAKLISRGEHPEKLQLQGAQELREVTRTFNTMADSLAELDSERNLLMAGISHDLRTPLARLRLAVEMMPEKDAAFKAGMVQDIADMDNIINQFLDFVRGTEGEGAQPTEIDKLIESMVERHSRMNRKVKTQLAKTPLVNVNQLAIQRLLSNLINNAFVHGKGEVIIRTENLDDTITISVLDNGPGIPLAEMGRLLRPFERLETARSNVTGSGLGLAIANRIAKLHHGNMELINRPSGGLEVKLTLPVQP